jgi:hypothetical protein
MRYGSGMLYTSSPLGGRVSQVVEATEAEGLLGGMAERVCRAFGYGCGGLGALGICVVVRRRRVDRRVDE